MAIDKKDVIRLLEVISIYLELKGENPFKISAYRKAAQALESSDASLAEITDFTVLNGIGKGTAAVIEEFIEKGTSDTLEQLKEEVPEGLIPLLNLPGLGGKKLAKLYQEIGITNEEQLKKACEDGEVANLKGFGKKTEEKILQAIEESSIRPDRLPINFMLPVAEKIEHYLSHVEMIERFSLAGSLRRMREMIKDLDFIIATDEPALVKDALLAMDDIKEVIAAGPTKVSIVLKERFDISVDFRIVKPDQFATTLHHFTGSKDHNVAMRQRAKDRGEKISEYGVEVIKTGEILTFDSEQAFFNHFDLHFISPELRENNGEIEAFEKDFPLISEPMIKGDLHMHTTWSDGAESVHDMVKHAYDRGYQYIAITDHSKFLRVANGLDEIRLRKQWEEIDRVQQLFPDIKIFKGTEMDILPDGRLDFSDDFLNEVDFVIGSIHSSFNQSEDKIMKRLFNAMENPNVNMIAHPTGRIIGRREGYRVDLDLLIEKAKETNTILELNANPNRFDLSAEWVRRAQDAGVNIAINTDAHTEASLRYMNEGVRIAKRGWLRPETVVNTWTKEQLSNLWKSKK